MSKVNVRYIVNDVEAAIPFYTDMLGFKVEMHPAPGFASLSRGDLQLLLNRPGAGGAGQAMRDGQSPAPGGWNRIQIEVEDIEATVSKLKIQEGASAAISSPATAASKSSSRIRPAIRSSCFSPFNRVLEPRPKHLV
jgi:predicted enzyme related to lactoylglutathione lyase